MEENELGLTPEETALVEADRTGAETQVNETIVETEQAPKETIADVITNDTAKEVKPEATKPPDGFVPHGALHEERMRRKELQKELEDYREKFSRVDERLKILGEKNTNQEIPSFEMDPLGYSKYEIDKLKGGFEDVSKRVPENIKRLEGEIETLRLQRVIERQEATFERDKPDYRDSLNFFIKTRIETAQEMGYDEDSARSMVTSELQEATQRAISNGKNPAEIIYNISAKYGFKSNNSAKEASKIDALKKAESATKSLSEVGGHAKGELSAESLADMSDEDFSKISDEQFRKAMGG